MSSKSCAIRLAPDAPTDPRRAKGCSRRISEKLGSPPRRLGSQARIDADERLGTTTSGTERVKPLETEDHELRREDTTLRSASALSRRSQIVRLGSSALEQVTWQARTIKAEALKT